MSKRPPLTPEERRELARVRAAAWRRARGSIPRDVYEGQSLKALKPWLALKMSMRSWYRAGQPKRAELAPGVPRKGERRRPAADTTDNASQPNGE